MADKLINATALMSFFEQWRGDLNRKIDESVGFPHTRSDYKVCLRQLEDCMNAVRDFSPADAVSRKEYDAVVAENNFLKSMQLSLTADMDPTELGLLVMKNLRGHT